MKYRRLYTGARTYVNVNANVQNCKESSMSIIIQKSHPEFHFLTNKDKYICIMHHANSSRKTAELIYNIFMARKCVTYNM